MGNIEFNFSISNIVYVQCKCIYTLYALLVLCKSTGLRKMVSEQLKQDIMSGKVIGKIDTCNTENIEFRESEEVRRDI